MAAAYNSLNILTQSIGRCYRPVVPGQQCRQVLTALTYRAMLMPCALSLAHELLRPQASGVRFQE